MVLDIPRIGLVAPVLAGASETDLSEGVGHLDGSSWPDQGGTDVLEAHDVTFFARLDQLKPDDTIVLRSECRQWTYRVSEGRVLTAGDPVEDQSEPTLVLVTCWPTDALYFTNQRYVLKATQVSTRATTEPVPAVENFSVPGLRLAAGLSANDVSVDTLGTPEGTLTESASLSPALRSSAASLDAAATAMDTFDSGLLAAERGEPVLWAPVGPPVVFTRAAPLIGRRPVWESLLDLNLGGTGTQITGAALHAEISVAGRPYHLAVHLTVSGGYWQIAGWDMRS